MIESCISTPGIRFYEREVAKPAEKVKVSVVVPVYNAEKYLEQCLDSLRKQTLKEIEIICVNDGSTDKSGEILAENAAYYLRRGVVTTSSMHYDKPLIAKVRVYKKTADLFEPGSGAQEADSRWREDLHNHLWHIFVLDYNKYLLADKELWRQSFPELGIDEKLQQKTADALIAEGK